MRFHLITLVTAVFLCFAGSGQVALQPLDKAAGNVPAFKRMDQIVQQYIDSQWMAGATLLVAQDGKIIYHQAMGVSNLKTKKKMRMDNIFRIASQTKAITSAALMILFDEGRLLLDDPVSKYIPAFAETKVLNQFNEKDSGYTTVPLKTPITIRHLLTHTSGIGYAQIGSPAYSILAAKAGVIAGLGVPGYSLADQVNRIATLPLEHQPGERFTYGLNLDVLGYLIEVVSGRPLDAFMRERIFEPLGMNDTWFYLPNRLQNRLVSLITIDSTTGRLKNAPEFLDFGGFAFDTDYPLRKGKFFAGGAGLVSTAYDYALFMQMILNGGTYNGRRILSKNAVQLMTMNQIGSVMMGENKFGLGFGIVTAEGAAKLGKGEGSLEWGGAFSSSYWIDPKRKLVAQLFINQMPMEHGDIHQKFVAQVNAAVPLE